MNKLLTFLLFTVIFNTQAQINSGRPGDAEELSDEVAEMSDHEYAVYEKKAGKESLRREWIIFGVLVAGGGIYYFIRSKQNK